MLNAIATHRGIIVAIIFILLILGLVLAYLHGRRIIRTEKTDAVFGNPERALGGWHWVYAGVASILVIWFYFSWDAARSFFPKSANELCQVARVDTAINPMRSVFPIDSRLLKGTSLLARDGTQLEQLDRNLLRSSFTDEEKAEYGVLIGKLRGALVSLADPKNLDSEVKAGLADIAQRVDAARASLADPNNPAPATAAELEEAAAHPG